MLTVSYFGFFYPLFCRLQIKAEQMPSLVGFLLKLTPVLDSQPGFWTHPHTAFWDSIFLDSLMDAQEVLASAAHCYHFDNSCFLLSKSDVLLGSPAILLLCTLCWETPVISNHPSGDESCCLPEGLVSWLSSYCLIFPSHSLLSGHTHLLTRTVSFFTFRSFPPSLESSFAPPPL